METALLRVGTAPSFPCSPPVHTDDGVRAGSTKPHSYGRTRYSPRNLIMTIATVLKGSFAVLLGHTQAAEAFAMATGAGAIHVRGCG